MTTLVLPPRFTGAAQRIWRSATDRGWTIRRLRGWRLDAPIEGDMAIYGEPLFAAAIAQQADAALLEPPLDWLTALPHGLTGRSITQTTLDALRPSEAPRFIKPADEKRFPAKVYKPGEALPDPEIAGGDTPVLISEVRRWRDEYRCFVLEGQVVAHSLYAVDGDLVEDRGKPADLAEAMTFAQRVVDAVEIPPACVVDVGRTQETGWAIIEANPCWGSGIYQCDPRPVLDVLARACIRHRALSPSDAVWQVPRAMDFG